LFLLLAARVRSLKISCWDGFSIALTENGATALPLVADDTTHGDCLLIPVLVLKDRSVVWEGEIGRTSN
jgi:hypothetical protein